MSCSTSRASTPPSSSSPTRRGGQINISARSLGEVNVQLIMEALGGGGHLTMAATQLTGVGIEESRRLLKGAIRNVMDRALPARDS